MGDPVVLVPIEASASAAGALAVGQRLADLLALAVQTLPLGEQIAAPAEAILAAAANGQAQLIVMSAHAKDARPADGIGDVALAVLLGAVCPVVLIDPTHTLGAWTLKHVLVPHDGSPTVSGALPPAAELARRADAELIVLQAAGAECADERGSMAPPLYMDQLQHEWPAWSGEFLHRLSMACSLADVRVRLRVERGAPAEETVRVARAESADLIVLAWRGRWEAHSAPTLKAVLRAAPCPTMVMRVSAS